MEAVRFDHLNLSVRDFEETAAWYRRIFGFEIVERGLYAGAPWGVLRSGDSMLCVYEEKENAPPEDDASGNHRIYHFGIRLRNEEEWTERVTREKVPTLYDSPVRYPHSSSWYVQDPSGHTIEVAIWKNDTIRFG